MSTETKTTHTPGPWKANVNYVDGPMGSNLNPGSSFAWNSVCQVFGPDADANATLITAAPDLLAACEAAEKLLLKFGDPFDGDDWQAVQDIRAAIAKAKA